jgi:monovalent cation:H+ antiporter-2, CPA2 family
MDSWNILSDIVLLLSLSLILGAISIRLGLSPIIGYLSAGMVLAGLGSSYILKSQSQIELISELGVSLLLFSLGLEFSWQKIKSLPIRILKSGFLQILITPLIFFLILKLCSCDSKTALVLGLIITLSSTATVIRSLVEKAEIDSQHGRSSMAVLLMQDIAVIPFTLIVGSLNTQQAMCLEFGLIKTIFIAIALILLAYYFLNQVANKILGIFSLENNREMAILLSITIAIGSAWISHQIGLSPAIGAFIAGMLLGSSPFAIQITADIAPLRILFLTLFFSSAGITANPNWIYEHFILVLIISFVIVLIKFTTSAVIFRVCNNTIPTSVATSICLSQIGEFAFVLGGIAQKFNIISGDTYLMIVSVTIVTLFVTPTLMKLAPRLGLIAYKIIVKDSKIDIDKHKSHHHFKEDIFIFGFGPAGMEIFEHLKEDFSDRICVFDLSQNSIKAAQELGLKGYIGDVRQVDVLKHHGIEHSSLVIITIPSFDAALRAIDNIKKIAPNAQIMVRSRYQLHYSGFVNAGAHEIVNEEATVGDHLGKLALEFLSKKL